MMKKIFIFLFTLVAFNSYSQVIETTTYYFIRHAEKEIKKNGNDNPNLSIKGLKRAVFWSDIFKNVKFDDIYSTKFNRTLQTATPIAKSKKLNIQLYNPKDLYNGNFKQITKGKTVLIVGHSNTTPLFINKILGKEKYLEIKETNYSNLYIVSIANNQISDVLMQIKY
jgi:2,3-bisphosphoglycerate-dependent phosphoglycerate mutase